MYFFLHQPNSLYVQDYYVTNHVWNLDEIGIQTNKQVRVWIFG
jgi:hypothetical protein